MRVSSTSRYAWRSLRRNRRRTLLSSTGIGMGVAISLIFLSWIGGERHTMLRAAAYSGVGHARIMPADFLFMVFSKNSACAHSVYDISSPSSFFCINKNM